MFVENISSVAQRSREGGSPIRYVRIHSMSNNVCPRLGGLQRVKTGQSGTRGVHALPLSGFGHEMKDTRVFFFDPATQLSNLPLAKTIATDGKMK